LANARFSPSPVLDYLSRVETVVNLLSSWAPKPFTTAMIANAHRDEAKFRPGCARLILQETTMTFLISSF